MVISPLELGSSSPSLNIIVKEELSGLDVTPSSSILALVDKYAKPFSDVTPEVDHFVLDKVLDEDG